MEVNFGSRYRNTDGDVFKLVGAAKDFQNQKSELLLFAPIQSGSVGDVLYMSKAEADKNLFAVSRYC